MSDWVGGGPLVGFAAAADAAVGELTRLVPGMDLWLVTQVVDERQVVVARAGRWAEIAPPGTQFTWQASLCRQMVTGHAPPVAPRIDRVPAYRRAAVGPLAKIKAYLGVPLLCDDGELFGTVCGYAGTSQPDSLAQTMPTVTLLARLLSTVLAGERRAHDRSVEAANAYALAEHDPSTGLRNRRGFARMLDLEQGRIHRFGSHATIVVVDLAAAVGSSRVAVAADGQNTLRGCTSLLTGLAQPGDITARTDPTELALLAVGTDALGGRALQVRLRRRLHAARLSAFLGVATRRPHEDLSATWRRARASAANDPHRKAAPRPGAPVPRPR